MSTVVTIAHISDPHVGSPHFVPNMMNRVIVELNELRPDVVICSGDLTTDGFRQEFKNWEAYAQRIQSPIYTVPGNHDARNVGYLHFEELVGERHWSVDVAGVRIVGVDSSEPDVNEGHVGRERYAWIREQLDVPAEVKIFVLHHHLLPIPGTGRERSTVMDAGDLLEVLITAGANIVLSGHKHVPYVWRLENLYVANAGTAASLRVRGYTKPCYNVLEVDGDEVKITRRYPFGGGSVIAHFSLSSGEQYFRELEPPVQQRTTRGGGELDGIAGGASGEPEASVVPGND
jgi:Icc protein